jgi:hypothetical protein
MPHSCFYLSIHSYYPFLNPPIDPLVCPESISDLMYVESLINIYLSFLRDKNAHLTRPEYTNVFLFSPQNLFIYIYYNTYNVNQFYWNIWYFYNHCYF